MKNKKISIFAIKKYLDSKGLIISKKIDDKKEKNIGNISRTFLAKKVLDMFPMFFSFLSSIFLLIMRPLLSKYFFIAKIEIFLFFIIILQLLL